MSLVCQKKKKSGYHKRRNHWQKTKPVFHQTKWNMKGIVHDKTWKDLLREDANKHQHCQTLNGKKMASESEDYASFQLKKLMLRK